MEETNCGWKEKVVSGETSGGSVGRKRRSLGMSKERVWTSDGMSTVAMLGSYALQAPPRECRDWKRIRGRGRVGGIAWNSSHSRQSLV